MIQNWKDAEKTEADHIRSELKENTEEALQLIRNTTISEDDNFIYFHDGSKLPIFYESQKLFIKR